MIFEIPYCARSQKNPPKRIMVSVIPTSKMKKFCEGYVWAAIRKEKGFYNLFSSIIEFVIFPKFALSYPKNYNR